jgi:hypothetical protein
MAEPSEPTFTENTLRRAITCGEFTATIDRTDDTRTPYVVTFPTGDPSLDEWLSADDMQRGFDSEQSAEDAVRQVLAALCDAARLRREAHEAVYAAWNAAPAGMVVRP